MNTDRFSQAEQKELITDPIERARREAENGILQFDLVLETIRKHIAPSSTLFRLTSGTILRLHDAALRGIHPLAGTYRNTPVQISGSRHAPPSPFDVADEVNSLCAYVNDKWASTSALHLGAFLLWKLNWVHPFADGNGRTARAISYLAMSTKLKMVLPGTPTIPEQISNDKGPYYDALEAADSAWIATQTVNVSVLESMLERMLLRQLLNQPTLPRPSEETLKRVLDARVHRAPPTRLKACFGTEQPEDQLWAIGDHLVLQIGPHDSLVAAEERQRSTGNPFPHLLSVGDAKAKLEVSTTNTASVLSRQRIAVGSDYALSLQRDAALVLSQPTIAWNDGKNAGEWTSEGALYIVRLGQVITDETFYTSFDFLIARHISSSS